MHRNPHRPDPPLTRARRGAHDERGFTVAQLAVSLTAALVLAAVVFMASRPGSSHRSQPKASIDTNVRPVVTALNRDVAATQHVLPYDVEGCAHQRGQRAVVSFLAD